MNASTTSVAGGGDPRLSVIVVCLNAEPLLHRCLEALAPQVTSGDVEVIAAADAARGDGRVIAARFPFVRWVAAAAGSTVPQRRLLGIARSRGALVGLIEDDCLVDAHWCRAAIAAHATADVAIGGAVEPGGYRRALDWAVYFCEYGRFMLPLRRAGSLALALAGNNVTYKRSALADLPGVGDPGAGFHDLFVHQAWERAGRPMRVEETLVVQNVNSWSLRHVTSVPFHHGRAFAGQRFQGQPASRRLPMSVLALALPVLKTARIVRDALSRKRFIGRLFMALPWIVVFMTSWSLGEAAGYLRGPGGSASQWR